MSNALSMSFHEYLSTLDDAALERRLGREMADDFRQNGVESSDFHYVRHRLDGGMTVEELSRRDRELFKDPATSSLNQRQ